MKVILIKDVAGMGAKGHVLNVKDGYARNFLIPRGLAKAADAGSLKEIERQEADRKRKADDAHAKMIEYQKKLGEVHLSFSSKANPKGHLFAAIKGDDIASELHKKGFKLITAKDIHDTPLKSVGEYTIKVRVEKKEIPIQVSIIAL